VKTLRCALIVVALAVLAGLFVRAPQQPAASKPSVPPRSAAPEFAVEPIAKADLLRTFPHDAAGAPRAGAEPLARWIEGAEKGVAPQDLPFEPGRAVVCLQPGARAEDLADADLSFRPVYEAPAGGTALDRTFEVAFRDRSVSSVIRRLLRDGRVAWAEPYYNRIHLFLVNDPLANSSGSWGQAYADQWSYHKIRAGDAAPYSTGADNQIIAVIDSGVDFTHPDLAGRQWTNPREIAGNNLDDDANGYVDDVSGWDFWSGDSLPNDAFGHGTLCAGIIGARSNNGIGIAGLNQKSKLLALKILSPSEAPPLETLEQLQEFYRALTPNIARAIRYAADAGARIANNSWGLPFPSRVVTDALVYAHGRNCAMFFASGNSSIDSHFFYPQTHWSVITVNASTQNDGPTVFTNFGVATDVIAPGGGELGDIAGADPEDGVRNVVSTIPAGSVLEREFPGRIVVPGYQRQAGTSFACPHAVGVASLVAARNPQLQVEQIRTIVRSTSDDVRTPGFDLYAGYGRVNAYRAVLAYPTVGARITEPASGAQVNSGDSLRVTGRAFGPYFVSWTLSCGAGSLPSSWTALRTVYAEAPSDIVLLDAWSTAGLTPGEHTLRLVGRDYWGKTAEHRVLVRIAPRLKSGWPMEIAHEFTDKTHPVITNLLRNGQKQVVFAASAFNLDDASTANRCYVHARDVRNQEIPGFPVALEGHIQGAIAVGDVDPARAGLEIVVNVASVSGYRLEMIHADGTRRTGGAWPIAKTEAWPEIMLANLDGSPGDEIVATEPTSVCAYRRDGTPLPGWPVTGLYYPASLAFGDMTGDGKPDVVVGTSYYYGGAFYQGSRVLSASGAAVASYSDPERAAGFGTPVLADMDGDDALEIVQTVRLLDGRTRIVVRNVNGTAVAGWPQHVPYGGVKVLVADVTGDMVKDVVAIGGELRLFSQAGAPVGSPVPVTAGYVRNPIAGDVSGDGVADVLFTVDLYGSGAPSRVAWAFDARNNALVPGWPVPDLGSDMHGPTYGDLDGDGLKEFCDSGIMIGLDGGFQVKTRMRVFDTRGRGVSVWTASGGSAMRTYAIPTLRGDANHDGCVDISDPIYLSTFLNQGGTPPAQFKEADFNQDGVVDPKDADDILKHLFG